MEMIPGFSKLAGDADIEEALEGDQLKHVEAMILSMTLQERHNPDIINGSRRKRIARGSGCTPQDINQLLDQFNEMRTMMRQVSSGRGPWAKMAKQFGGGPGMPGMPGMAGAGGGGPMPSLPRSSGGGGKKSGKAARKAKRKQKAKSGRR